jgi:hypothetical protein
MARSSKTSVQERLRECRRAEKADLKREARRLEAYGIVADRTGGYLASL